MPTSLVSTGVQFPDSTIQTTAASASSFTFLNTTTVAANTQIVDITTPFTSSYKHFLIVGTNIIRTGPTSNSTVNLQIYRGGSLVTSDYAFDSIYTYATRGSYGTGGHIPLLNCMPDTADSDYGNFQVYIWNAFNINNLSVTGQTNTNGDSSSPGVSGLANITANCPSGTGTFGGIRMRNGDTTWGRFSSATFYIYGIS